MGPLILNFFPRSAREVTLGDGDFVFGRALSQTIETAILPLAGATILPFNFVDLAVTMTRYVEEIREEHARIDAAPELDFDSIDAALERLREAIESYETALAQLSNVSSQRLQARPELRRLDQRLYTSERRLAHD
jgi:hypothetical protein